MNVAQRKAITEREWLAGNGKTFGDDEQAMLCAQLSDILRGTLDMQINDRHVEAAKIEAEALLATGSELPF